MASLTAESWVPRSRAPALLDDEVHVWAASLDVPAALRESYRVALSDDETARAARYQASQDAERYVAGRGILRHLLGDYLGAPPATLRFVYGENGKPALRAGGPAGIHFNLAHSAGLALIAITRAAEVGVDVEAVVTMPDMESVAAAQFSPEEQDVLHALPPGETLRGFFLAWTRKEACIKAMGAGLADRIDSHWSVATLEPAAGFVAAVATSVPLRASCYSWVTQTA